MVMRSGMCLRHWTGIIIEDMVRLLKNNLGCDDASFMKDRPPGFQKRTCHAEP